MNDDERAEQLARFSIELSQGGEVAAERFLAQVTDPEVKDLCGVLRRVRTNATPPQDPSQANASVGNAVPPFGRTGIGFSVVAFCLMIFTVGRLVEKDSRLQEVHVQLRQSQERESALRREVESHAGREDRVIAACVGAIRSELSGLVDIAELRNERGEWERLQTRLSGDRGYLMACSASSQRVIDTINGERGLLAFMNREAAARRTDFSELQDSVRLLRNVVAAIPETYQSELVRVSATYRTEITQSGDAFRKALQGAPLEEIKTTTQQTARTCSDIRVLLDEMKSARESRDSPPRDSPPRRPRTSFEVIPTALKQIAQSWRDEEPLLPEGFAESVERLIRRMSEGSMMDPDTRRQLEEVVRFLDRALERVARAERRDWQLTFLALVEIRDTLHAGLAGR